MSVLLLFFTTSCSTGTKEKLLSGNLPAGEVIHIKKDKSGMHAFGFPVDFNEDGTSDTILWMCPYRTSEHTGRHWEIFADKVMFPDSTIQIVWKGPSNKEGGAMIQYR